MREYLKSGRHKERMEQQKLAKKCVLSFIKPRHPLLIWQAPLQLMYRHLKQQHWNQLLRHHRLLQRVGVWRTLPPKVLPNRPLLQRAMHRRTMPPKVLPHHHLLQWVNHRKTLPLHVLPHHHLLQSRTLVYAIAIGQ